VDDDFFWPEWVEELYDNYDDEVAFEESDFQWEIIEET
jgi:hypothetical protein